MKQTAILKTFVVVVIAAGAVVLFARQGPQAVEPTPAPAWELRDLEGELVKSADFKGKVVVLNFWATWCPPCRMEIPGFVDVQEKYEDQGVAIIGVSLDEAGPAVVRQFAEEMEINYPVVMGDPKIVGAFGGVRALPTTYFIDREGNLRNVHAGFLSQSALEKTIEPLL